jgi:predicted RNA-binding Zn ribbon-like protein
MDLPTGWTAPKRLGGRVCVDFANTVDRHVHDGAVVRSSADKLEQGYASLLAWAYTRGLLNDGAAQHLAERARREPDQADQEFCAARQLRSAMHAVFDAAAAGRAGEADVSNLLELVGPIDGIPRLQPGDGGARYELAGLVLSEPLLPVRISLSSLIAEGELGQIGRCQGTTCSWHFMDFSPGLTRRWCSSQLCGNRERARRHYAKARHQQ